MLSNHQVHQSRGPPVSFRATFAPRRRPTIAAPGYHLLIASTLQTCAASTNGKQHTVTAPIIKARINTQSRHFLLLRSFSFANYKD